ncbi:MAG TPA: peptidylprolyl isomerase [Alphaproteobacteria bacterium]|nr:peptidylprolyl isomerase [Alphaproteobacteria bacterium]
MKAATTGDNVRVHYRGTLNDGTEFDSSSGREPLEFTLGSGEVIPGVENAVMGMTEGETKKVTVPPDEAYGEPNPGMVHEVPRAEIPEDIPLQIGSMLSASDGQGNQMRLTVVDADEETVTLDANHPLAGKSLNFELTLEKIAA